MEVSEKFKMLFLGSLTAIGTEEGGCKRNPHYDEDDEWGWWEQNLEAHLMGEPCGVYPVWAGKVRWGCVDWDTGPGDWTYARNTQKVIHTLMGLNTWIEASRSKGFHLWWFVDEWVDMGIMRQALLAACQIAGAPVREVNPKQMSLDEDQLGNYVRLPYPGMLAGQMRDGFHARTMYRPDQTPILFRQFVESAWTERSTAAEVVKVASYYKEPIKVVPKYSPMTGDVYQRLRGLAGVMWRLGPLDFDDRSSKLYRFARLVVEGGHHTPDEVGSLIGEFDIKWFDPPKYAGRRDGDQRIAEMVERVFQE